MKLSSVRVVDYLTVSSVQDIDKTLSFITSQLHVKPCLYLLCENISSFGSEDGLSRLIQALECNALNRLSIHGHVGTLPEHYDPQRFSQALATIELFNCRFEEDPMELFENLPSLRSLSLYRDSFIGKEIVCSATGFPQLRVLEFGGLLSLESWRVEKGAMHNLCWLTIEHCDQLKMLPHGLRFLTSLTLLDLQYMPQHFKNRVQLINGVHGQDFDKVRHVRSILL